MRANKICASVICGSYAQAGKAAEPAATAAAATAPCLPGEGTNEVGSAIRRKAADAAATQQDAIFRAILEREAGNGKRAYT
mmetsp:Transcript_115894/g.162887  ORF Transcript_115894/g.162887 Transcript_115894/m.162887 type:complete len:81 (-) Transcript_115894:19-261(-)